MAEVSFTPLSMVRCNTKYTMVKLTDFSGTLDGAYFSIKENLADESYLVQKTLEDGITQDSQNPEIITIRVDQADTEDVVEGTYWYDLTIEADNDRFTPLLGRINIVQGVTDYES